MHLLNLRLGRTPRRGKPGRLWEQGPYESLMAYGPETTPRNSLGDGLPVGKIISGIIKNGT